MEESYKTVFGIDIPKDEGKISTGRKLLKLAEECAELAAVINGSFFKAKDVTDDIFGEMADVYTVFASLWDKMSVEAQQRFLDKVKEKNQKFVKQLEQYEYPDIVIGKLSWL